jgi:phage terminase large subunit
MLTPSCHPTSKVITLPHLFIPRDHQADIIRAVLYGGYKSLFFIIHRRYGKTLTAVNLILMLAMERVGLHLYLFPQTNQCRLVIWKGRGSDGILFLDRIPIGLIKNKNNSEMSVELINGSIIKFVGSNNYDALVGINALTIVYDEYSLQDPEAREYLSPVLVESGGTEILFGTPRGHNHAYDAYQIALNNPSWYVKKLTVDDTTREDGTPVITQEMLENERRNGKDEEIIMQEYYCSFEIGNRGAYFTEQLAQAEYEGRICDFQISKTQAVHTVWDIGVRDATAILLFQSDGWSINIIGYIEGNNKGVEYYWDELHVTKEKLGFNRWGHHWGPHDIRVREWGNSARSRLASAAAIGLHFQVIPRLSEQDNIAAGRSLFPICNFHATNCRRLLLCLREAMREYDEDKKIFKQKPFDNWALHGFDAFNYTGVVWRHQFAHPDLNMPMKYQSSF